MPTIRQIKISHCKSAVRKRNMPKRQDINKIMIIGSGPIIIGQACEFDYSGTQACKALKKLGYEIVLVNSNPATIMTDPDVADITYIEPLNLDRLTQIIEQERPDALLPNLGGQSGLNLCSELDKAGVLKKFNVQVIGVQVDAIERGEDRIEFKNAMKDLGIGMPRSEVAYTIDEAVKIAEELKYPVVLRPAYTMGGAGGGMVYNVDELKVVCERGLQASLVGQVLVEECIFGWEELELEVVRDADNNKITVCFIENIDPIGVHTGDSFCSAPMLTIPEDVQKLVSETMDKFGHIDIFVNNAGITRDGLMIRMSEDDWDLVMDINLKGAFNCIKAVARPMMKQRSGAIINMASIVGVMGNPGQANYVASKAGLIGLTKTTAKEFASRGIRCNAVAPGFIRSAMTDVLSDDVKKKYLDSIPLGEFGETENIADVVAFLASDMSKYVTGQVINVDGGLVM
jgi:NAD(P)-dependent dehydrogenase (short-subunit alcohol dehydrogenase family)